MDPTHLIYQSCAIITTIVGVSWTVVRLYYGVKKLRREALVDDALAAVKKTQAEVVICQLRDSVPDAAPPSIPPLLPSSTSMEPKQLPVSSSEHPMPNPLPVFDEEDKKRGS